MKTRSLLLLGFSCWAMTQGFAYQVTLFPASAVYDPDTNVLNARLGFTSGLFFVESFENESLMPALKSNLRGRFADEDEHALCPNCWDGHWASSPSDDAGQFDITIPGVRVFGVGIGDNDFGGNEELSINQGEVIALNSLPGHVSNGQGRAFYLKIQAEPGDADLHSVRVAKGYTLRFDHLVLQRGDDAGVPEEHGAAFGAASGPMPRRSPGAAEAAPDRVTPGPAPEHRAPPVRRTVSALPSEAWNRGTALVSMEGKRYLGDQLNAFFVDPEGAVSTSKPAWLYLYYTEGKPFRLHGQVWLGGPTDAMLFPGDLPDGFALFIREWTGLERYALTSRGADVKRRLFHGEKQTDIINAGRFDEPLLETWTPFFLDVSWDRIVFALGDQTIVLDGPLDVDGANKIALAPGTRVRELRIEVFDGL